MALYRKYRPATFAEVVGQEHVTEPLSTALDAGRVNHAYLFSGPRGCGKTSSARILARSLNCVEGPTSTPCGVCPSCVALGPGGPGNLDVIELDAASHNKVEQARDLRERAFYAPAESRFRIYIIDEAHMVTTDAFNALLKIVEEPPEHLIFIFATTEPEKVLATIKSRTHHYPFRLLPPSTMRGLLEKVCDRESVTVAPPVFPLVIRAGGGSPRDSLSVLDQLLAGAGSEGVTYPRALALLGVTDVALIDEAVDALAADDGAALFGTIDKVMEAGHDPRRFATDLLDRLRDLILLRAVPDAGERGLVDAPGDQLVRMQAEAERIGPATLARYAELVHEGLGEMRGATAPRLLLEVVCARMLLPSVSDAESAALQRIERIERRIEVTRPIADSGDEGQAGRREFRPTRMNQPPTPTPEPAPTTPDPVPVSPPQPVPTPPPTPEPAPTRPAPEPTPAPEPEPAPPPEPAPAPEPMAEAVPEATPEPEPVPAARPGEPDAAAVRAVWSELLSKVRDRSRTVEVMLSGATVAAVTGGALVLRHDSGPLAKRLVEPRNAEVIKEALRDLFGVEWDVRCEVGGADTAATRAPAKSTAPAKPAGPPKFSRPSRAKAEPKPAEPAPSAEEDWPLPSEPDRDPGEEPSTVDASPAEPEFTDGPPPPSTPDEEDEMFAEAAQPVSQENRRDPDEVAIELLQNELGARRIDGA
ncbi:DNA polymerase III subunits gamma/tau [Aldersonia kunmingensis]|uniref:DNA polymerase III subunits gamma/tau n=1 Tax=Aldersonia kunmingensis TaxID=408066 RepID=UPI0008341C57|nr:DNA polymerase III subunits gamma/tau [Aldersonia kunmingensis]